jgi:LysR family pca operon transcriptional activator
MAIPNGIRLRHLDAFLAVCEKGTISGAAKARHISQPALSKTIGELEKLLNATLFNRAEDKPFRPLKGKSSSAMR